VKSRDFPSREGHSVYVPALSNIFNQTVCIYHIAPVQSMGVGIVAAFTAMGAALGKYYIPETGAVHYTFLNNTGHSQFHNDTP
jgi:hypothetical protein